MWVTEADFESKGAGLAGKKDFGIVKILCDVFVIDAESMQVLDCRSVVKKIQEFKVYSVDYSQNMQGLFFINSTGSSGQFFFCATPEKMWRYKLL